MTRAGVSRGIRVRLTREEAIALASAPCRDPHVGGLAWASGAAKLWAALDGPPRKQKLPRPAPSGDRWSGQ